MKFLLFISFFSISVCFSQHVSFITKNPADTGISIYFDYQGMLYPDGLNDVKFREANYSIRNYLTVNKAYSDSLFSSFGVEHGNEISETSLAQLNARMLVQKASEIHERTNGKLLLFGIHGYRKSYLETEKDVSSVREFTILDSNLTANKTPEFQLVKIFWDSRYDCCFSTNHKKNTQLFQLFEEAYSSADLVGNSLEIFFSEFNDNFNVIAHSLGCKVVTRALINCSSKAKIKAVLIAPAMGRNFFLSEYKATITAPDIIWKIVFSEKDFVLKKKDNKLGIFGPGAMKYGETTFGLNYKHCLEEAASTAEQLFLSESVSLVDLTSIIGKRHSWRVYLRQSQFQSIAEYITGIR